MGYKGFNGGERENIPTALNMTGPGTANPLPTGQAGGRRRTVWLHSGAMRLGPNPVPGSGPPLYPVNVRWTVGRRRNQRPAIAFTFGR